MTIRNFTLMLQRLVTKAATNDSFITIAENICYRWPESAEAWWIARAAIGGADEHRDRRGLAISD
jgi:hypothetical protein